MFTGLVEAIGHVKHISAQNDVTLVTVQAPFSKELERGQSVALSGVCSTVTAHTVADFTVAFTQETLRVSRFHGLKFGSALNLERALTVDARLDGHIVAGHVDGVARVRKLVRGANAAELWLEFPPELGRYIVHKGSVCVDGVSLTVASLRDSEQVLSVAVIPETLAVTTLGSLHSGDLVNLETDMIARYVERLLMYRNAVSNLEASQSSGLTLERLTEMGW